MARINKVVVEEKENEGGGTEAVGKAGCEELGDRSKAEGFLPGRSDVGFEDAYAGEEAHHDAEVAGFCFGDGEKGKEVGDCCRHALADDSVRDAEFNGTF